MCNQHTIKKPPEGVAFLWQPACGVEHPDRGKAEQADADLSVTGVLLAESSGRFGRAHQILYGSVFTQVDNCGGYRACGERRLKPAFLV